MKKQFILKENELNELIKELPLNGVIINARLWRFVSL